MNDNDAIDALTDTRVIVVGCGQMGGALAGGIVRSGRIDPDRLTLIDSDPDKAAALADELGASVDLSSAPRADRVWIVAVKPDDVAGALASYRNQLTADDTVVSVAAGVDLHALRTAAGTRPAVVRAMPNTPALVGQGVTGIMADGAIDTGPIESLFGGVGEVVCLEREKNFDALTAISGSGPAYIFTALEALADGGVNMGLNRQMARKLAVETVAGAAALVADHPDTHTAELKDRVASPAGTTIEALSTLESHGFRHALISAVKAAARRSRHLGNDT